MLEQCPYGGVGNAALLTLTDRPALHVNEEEMIMAKQEKLPAKTSAPPLIERWSDQWAEPFARLRTEIDRLFDDVGGRSFASGLRSRLTSLTGPALDFREVNGEYRLEVDVPGMKVEDIEIRVADGILRVRGERKEEHEAKEEGYVFSERSYGSFERAIELPKSVNPDNIKADCRDGVLTIHLPKTPEAMRQEKKIPIAVK